MSDTDEEFVPEEEAENPAAIIKKLRERLRTAEKERQEYLDGWQRARADFANLKRDEEMRREHTTTRITASLAEDLVPVLDSFEMAANHDHSKELDVLYKQFLNALKRMGIEQFGATGDAFDPRRYEALKEEETGSAEQDHRVASILRSGYAIADHIIRPAQVSIYIHKK